MRVRGSILIFLLLPLKIQAQLEHFPLMRMECGKPVPYCEHVDSIKRALGSVQMNVTQAGYPISRPGNYILADNITITSAATTAISITSDNVHLDLNGFTITGPGGSGTADIINVSNVGNITIKNGMVQNPERSGIRVENSTDVLIENIRAQVTSGATLAANDVAGFELASSCSDCCIQNCTALNIASASNAFGFTTDGGNTNTIKNCVAKGTQTTSTNIAVQATGIRFTANESGSSISDNMVCDTSAALGSIPYGIRLEYGNPTLSTAGLPVFTSPSSINAIEWSPDDRFLALATSAVVDVYEFRTNELVFLASFSHGNVVSSLSWSPDGRYLAFGGADSAGELGVLEFNGVTLSLIGSKFSHGATIREVDWAPNGRYIALGAIAFMLIDEVRVLSWDPSGFVSAATFPHGAEVDSVHWSFDSQYLGIGGDAVSTIDVRVLQFASSAGANTLTQVASFMDPESVESVRWSPNGRYLATGNNTDIGGFNIDILEFSGSALTSVATSGSAISNALRWSEDGQFIFKGGSSSVEAYQFNGSSLALIASNATGSAIEDISLSKNGKLLVKADSTSATFEVQAFSALVPPAECVISNNTVKTTQGAATGQAGQNQGLGIVAASGDNLVINNTASENDLNYAFSINVFEQFVANLKASTPLPIFNFASPTP